MIHPLSRAALQAIRNGWRLAFALAVGAMSLSACTGESDASRSTAQQTPQSAAATATASTPPKSGAVENPRWTQLTTTQQTALAPLAQDWDQLEAARKKKWLEIAAKYPTMPVVEQQRIQARMREWVQLTPEQRRAARESYARTKKLHAEQKSAQWDQYQQLPEEKKQQLASEAEAKKRLALARLQTPKAISPTVVIAAPVAPAAAVPTAPAQPVVPLAAPESAAEPVLSTTDPMSAPSPSSR